jgi:hypothetical protein
VACTLVQVFRNRLHPGNEMDQEYPLVPGVAAVVGSCFETADGISRGLINLLQWIVGDHTVKREPSPPVEINQQWNEKVPHIRE